MDLYYNGFAKGLCLVQCSNINIPDSKTEPICISDTGTAHGP